MGKLTFEISTSLDGFVAGPNASTELPLGEGGEQLHEWIFGQAAWRQTHGEEGGSTGPDNDVVEESLASKGATIMGRRMYSGGAGSWADDPKADGWWGDEPPFGHPVFILTHHPRETVTKKGGTTFTFVTDGIESALEQARAAAGDRDVAIGGGADVAQQYLKAGLLEQFDIHLVPVFLGGGVRLFDNLGAEPPRLERTRVIDSPAVTHLRYQVV
jgi:dihydrofolate reductase